jgi:hypothetical protein
MYNIYKYVYLTTPSQNTPATKPKSDSEAPKVDFKSLLEQKHLDRDELHGVVVHGKKMSDDIVNSVTDKFGWWFAGGMGVSFIIGVAFGMIKNMHPDPEKRTPIPGSAAKYAIKALLYGSVLCTSVAAVTAYGTSKALGVKNLKEFGDWMKGKLPKQPEPEQKKATKDLVVTEKEIKDLEEAWKSLYNNTPIGKTAELIMKKQQEEKKKQK